MLNFYFHHVSLLDDVIPADGAEMSFGAGLAPGAGLKEGFPVYHLGPDKKFFKIGMDGGRCFRDEVAFAGGPGPALVFPCG